VKGLGADAAIDYSREKFVDAVRALAPEGLDLVYDTVGGHVQAESYRRSSVEGCSFSIITCRNPGSGTIWARTNFVFVSPNGGSSGRSRR